MHSNLRSVSKSFTWKLCPQCGRMREINRWKTPMAETRRYSELRQLDSFEERYRYLRLRGTLGERTFGFDRWVNQRFYKSYEWLSVRDQVITRDNGCDLGV